MQKIMDPSPPVSEKEIREILAAYRLDPPKEYLTFIEMNNGGQPTLPDFTITGFEGNPEGRIQVFFGFNTIETSEDIGSILEAFHEVIPQGILPIANTEGDDFLVLDLRGDGESVFYWDKRRFWGNELWDERHLYFVSKSFGEFLLSLHLSP
jgi:hypothetical protein